MENHVLTAAARRRSALILLALLLAPAAGCGDTSAFHYDYQGTLLRRSDGKPAAHVKLFVTDAEGMRLLASDDDRWEYWRAAGTTTDAAGQFAGEFNGDETYWKWLGLLPIAPPARELEGVYILLNRHCQWEAQYLPLSPQSQSQVFEGGRRLAIQRVTIRSD